MCAACVAQGAVYVGGAVAGLQVMRARARHRLDARRAADAAPEHPDREDDPEREDDPGVTPTGGG